MPVSNKFRICQQINYCTLILSTHSLTLTQTNEKPNGKIVPHKTKHYPCPNPADDIFKQMQIECRRGNRRDNNERMNETLWPAADVPSDYCNSYVRASPVLELLSSEPVWDQNWNRALRMQYPVSQGGKTKPFAQITSHPSLFNGSRWAAVRASGLRDECVNDYSLGVGSSTSQVDYSRSFPPLFLFPFFLSITYPLTSFTPPTHV